MSADDIIFISKSTFNVYHTGFEDPDLGEPICVGTSLEDAINKAQKWENEVNQYPAEYGIRFIT